MDFHALLAKMKEIDRAPVQSAPAAEACGDPVSMPPGPMSAHSMSTPEQAPPAHPSMSVNLNAQGMDSIEQMMKLFQKVNPDMMPKIAPPPMVTTMPSISAIKPQIPPMKMLPDFDADNNDKVGGEMDLDKPSMMDMDKDLDMDDMGSQPGKLGASLDRDGDGDHDMDDHAMEKDLDDQESDDDMDIDSDDMDSDDSKKEDGGFQASTTKPQEKFSDIDYMTNKLAGGMNGPKDTYPKVADGDNPMQRVKESEDSFRASIRADLRKRLAEAKGAK